MKLLKSLALSLTLISAVTAAHAGDDRLEQKAYQDPAVQQTLEKARTIISNQGYQIIDDIEIDEDWGKLYVKTEAIKNGKKYDVRLDYPTLNNLKAKLD